MFVSLDALLDAEFEQNSGEHDDDMTVDGCSQTWIDTVLCAIPDETGLALDGGPIEDDQPALASAFRQRKHTRFDRRR
jgi:hypothetical protein